MNYIMINIQNLYDVLSKNYILRQCYHVQSSFQMYQYTQIMT